MWIFIDFFPKATWGTLLLVMLLPFILLFGCFYYAIKYKSKGALAGGIATLLLFAVMLGPDLMDNVQKQQYKDPDNLQIQITDKKNADHKVFHFSCAFTNHFREKITGTRAEIVITNSQGDVLLQADIPSVSCDPGGTDAFTLEVTVRGETAEELYYTDYAYLNISVHAHYVQYEKSGYDLGEYKIHAADENALKSTYNRAVSAYESGDLKGALELFSTLGNYEDSENYRDLLMNN